MFNDTQMSTSTASLGADIDRTVSAPSLHPDLLGIDTPKYDRTEILRSDRYVRERFEPQPSDGLYITLSDLRLALDSFRTNEKITILDYGCGGSPYRFLFPRATYLRADVSGHDLDYHIAEDGSSDAPSGCCDLILSTQVIEHVPDVPLYLSECFRLLRPGGRLICSSHGMYEEHPCPNDWNRWTSQGFRRDLQRAGFVVSQLYKLTTGPRAMIFLLDLNFKTLSGPKTSLFGLCCGVFKRLYSRNRVWLHRMADQFFSNCRVVKESDMTHATYISVLADCTKPAR
jgi:SAM-dependent methyltransferase